MSRGFVLITSLMLLAACGGGGGGGGGAKSSATASQLIANAGADLTVNMSERVYLDPKVLVANVTSAKLAAQGLELRGASDNKDAIVALTWTKTEGPDLAITSSGLNDGVIYFSAPATGSASSVRITFKLTIANAAGVSAEDTITITVIRVNQAPVANAGTDLAVEDESEVRLSGSLSADAEGTLSKYQWSQLAGQSVTLTNPGEMNTSFIAPAVATESRLEFELVVTDNEGKSSTDRVSVLVRPRNAPRVELYFPTKNAIYTDTSLTVFGAVSVKEASIASLTVDLGSGALPAVVNPDGSWRLDNLAVPTGVAEFTVNVEAIDSLGRKGNANLRLKTSTRNTLGEGQDWDNVVGISVDPETNRLWVIDSSKANKPTRLFAIDLNNGDRSQTVSDFSNSAQGVSNEALTQMVFDAQTKKVFVAAAPASESILDQILQIDTLTGSRSLVSDKTRGAGPDLKLPYGISAAQSGEIFVADNLSANLLAVNISTGDRTTIADANTAPYAIDAPLFLVADNNKVPERLFFMPNSATNYVLELDLTKKPAVSRIVTGGGWGSGPSLFGTTIGLFIDNKANKLFVGAQFGALYAIDIATGARSTITRIDGLFDQITFDEKRGLLYAIDNFPETLYAVDPVSGKSAIVSKAVNF